MNNLISFSDFVVESKDPKVGTGKKPKNWIEVESRDYWQNSKSGEKFTKREREEINEFASKYNLRIIEWGFGTSIRLEKEMSAVLQQVYGPHKTLFSISIVKCEDEWFWVFFNSVEKAKRGDDEDFYKADQLDGLSDLLEHVIQHCGYDLDKV